MGQWVVHTGSSRKNDKSKSCRKGVYFYKHFIFIPFPGRKIATNYSPTPSRALKNVLRRSSKAAPPTLAEWKSGSRNPKSRSWRVLTGPQWTQRVDILGENQFCIPITETFSFDPNSDLSAGQRPVCVCFAALFGSQCLISTQPTLQAQPLREALKHL